VPVDNLLRGCEPNRIGIARPLIEFLTQLFSPPPCAGRTFWKIDVMTMTGRLGGSDVAGLEGS
jgi:hypothetical protein